MKRNSSNILARECITDALLRLIETKPLSAITISELAKLAGVSRMTFYRNYHSKEEVFESYLDNILEDYQAEKSALSNVENYYDVNNLVHCFAYFEKYRKFLDGLFQCGFGNFFLKRLTAYIVEHWSDKSGSNRYELHSFAGALYNLYISWTENGCRESVEDMAHILNRIYTKESLA